MGAYPGGIRVTGYIAPSDTSDTYATHISYLGQGGYMEVVDISARNLIPTQRRRTGMMVHTQNDTNFWYLTGDVSGNNWKQFVTVDGVSGQFQTFISQLSGNSISQSFQIAELSGRPVPDIFRVEIQSISSGLLSYTYAASGNAVNQSINLLTPVIYSLSAANLENTNKISQLISITGSLQNQINSIVTESTQISAGSGLSVIKYGPYSYALEITGSFGDSNLRSEVIAISSGIENKFNSIQISTTNGITSYNNGLSWVLGLSGSLGDPALRSEVVAISSYLQSQITNLTGNIGKSAGIQGRVVCTSANTYTISHPLINPAEEFPVVSLEIEDEYSDIFVQGIYERTGTYFKVVLGGTPSSSTAILWHISTQMVNGGGDISKIEVSNISANLQNQINSIVTESTQISAGSGLSITQYGPYSYSLQITGNTNLISEVSNGLTTSFTYDGNGNVSTLTTSRGVRTFNYNINGDLISVSGSGDYNNKSFVYDISGNLQQIILN